MQRRGEGCSATPEILGIKAGGIQASRLWFSRRTSRNPGIPTTGFRTCFPVHWKKRRAFLRAESDRARWREREEEEEKRVEGSPIEEKEVEAAGTGEEEADEVDDEEQWRR